MDLLVGEDHQNIGETDVLVASLKSPEEEEALMSQGVGPAAVAA